MGAAATGQQSGQPESEPTQEVRAGRRGRTVPCWAASSLPRVHSLDSKAPLGPGAIMTPIFPADWSGPRSGAQIQAGVDRGVPRPQPPWSSEYGRAEPPALWPPRPGRRVREATPPADLPLPTPCLPAAPDAAARCQLEMEPHLAHKVSVKALRPPDEPKIIPLGEESEGPQSRT